MPVLRRKQSERFAETLNSPPLTWMSQCVALRNGMMPGSRRLHERAEREKIERAVLFDVQAVFHGVFELRFFEFCGCRYQPERKNTASYRQKNNPELLVRGLHFSLKKWLPARAKLGARHRVQLFFRLRCQAGEDHAKRGSRCACCRSRRR